MDGSENEASPVSRAQPDDELSLLDLVKFIRHHGAILLGGTLIGGALGLAVAFALPAQWEASALIRVGQLEGFPVETLPRVVDRVTQNSFKDDALKRMGVSPDESDPKTGLLLSSLKVKIDKSDLIGVRVRSTNPDDAIRFVDALIAELADMHVKVAEPTRQHRQDRVEEINMESRRLDSEIERLNGSLVKATREFSAANFSQVALMSSVLLAREVELRVFQEHKRALQELLSPAKTFPTSSFGRAEASEQPVFPKKSLFAASGLVIGLLMGVLLSLWRSRVPVDKKC
jgi:uncharacterized protein involved in exopolysaccharide biosynthesis